MVESFASGAVMEAISGELFLVVQKTAEDL